MDYNDYAVSILNERGNNKMKRSISFPGNIGIKTCLVLLISICGCASPVHREIFSKDVSFKQKTFSTAKETAYSAVINSILELGFVIDKENASDAFVLAKRYFQRGKKNIIIALQTKIVSLPDKKSIVYLNAFETTERVFIADRTRFFMFIIPLPGGGGKEASQVKVGEACIDDKDFYSRVFSAVETNITRLDQQPVPDTDAKKNVSSTSMASGEQKPMPVEPAPQQVSQQPTVTK